MKTTKKGTHIQVMFYATRQRRVGEKKSKKIPFISLYHASIS